ncbi:MAG: hypothetical protein U0270_13570 [Labilithrix sp.]
MARKLLALLPVFALAAVACVGEQGDDADENVGVDEGAVMDRGTPRGAKTVHFPMTNGAPDEICVLPNHLSMADYDKDDLESEQELCSYSFHGAAPREADVQKTDVAICPKLSSTNPGTDIHELLPGKSKAETEAAICKLQDRPTKHLAKYKQSITCSYTPSILGYYHLSRLLGGAGDVKPAVVRTMGLPEHKAVVSNALNILRNQGDGEYPKVSWLSFQKAESNPSATPKKDALYTQDLLQIYGGLQENARGESRYSEINKRGAAPNPAGPFTRTAQWASVASGKPMSQIAGRTLKDSAQTVQVVKDISEMLVMDYLMSQQDRFGNIHEIDYYYSLDAKGEVEKVKKSKVDDGEKPMPANAVLVKKMILKDNDCGGSTKDNVVKKAGLIDQMRHMSPNLYANIQWLAANFAAGTEVPKFLTVEALFAQADINMLRTNLAELGPKLKSMCTSGKLMLDADLEDHLAGKGHDPAACNAIEAPKH